MPRSSKLLLVSTDQDISLPLFLSATIKSTLNPTIVKYGQNIDEFNELMRSERFDLVYLRDPFNKGVYLLEETKKQVESIKSHQRNAAYIDGADTLEALLWEDKWRQYQTLAEFMPHTELLVSRKQSETGQYLFKKRVSARARDVKFEFSPSMLDQEYILQEKLDIVEEYRVYAVKGIVLDTVSLRTSKTPKSKVRVLETDTISEPVREFSNQILEKLSWLDLGGLDIALTASGQLKLLEVNRSCQFARYTQLTGINLAEELLLDA